MAIRTFQASGLHSHPSVTGDINLMWLLSWKKRPSHSVSKNKREKSGLLLASAVGKGSQTGRELASSPGKNLGWGGSHCIGGRGRGVNEKGSQQALYGLLWCSAVLFLSGLQKSGPRREI